MCLKERETKCCLRPCSPLTLIFRTEWHLNFDRTMRRSCFGVLRLMSSVTVPVETHAACADELMGTYWAAYATQRTDKVREIGVWLISWVLHTQTRTHLPLTSVFVIRTGECWYPTFLICLIKCSLHRILQQILKTVVSSSLSTNSHSRFTAILWRGCGLFFSKGFSHGSLPASLLVFSS